MKEVENDSGDDVMVADCIARISRAWRDRKYDDLLALLDENIVMVMPGLNGQLDGRENLIRSYQEFMERASISRYEEKLPVIRVWGDTALARYRWEIEWRDRGDVPHQAAGHDVFCLARRHDSRNAAWRAVWRTVSFEVNA